MAKNDIPSYDATAANNTDVQSVDISENCSPAGINNAIREVMADLKNVDTGAVALTSPSASQLNVDNLRLDGNTISSTDTNGNITLDPNGTGVTAITGGFTATDGCTITTADNTTQLTLKSTDADANNGPILDMVRDSSSPADGDEVGVIRFKFDDDAGESNSAAQIQAKISDASNGTEDGTLEILTLVNGSSRKMIKIKPTEVVINEDSQDVDFRVESLGDANSFVVEGATKGIGMGTNDPTIDSSLAGVSVPGGSRVLHIHDTDGAYLKLSDPASGSNRGAQFAMIGTTTIVNNCESGDMIFGTGNTERMKILAGGNVDISAGHIFLDNGYGIDFSATGNSSGTTTSELLDDYEEGTWTPTASGGYTVSSSSGAYTKIGRVVHLWGTVQFSAVGGNTSTVVLGTAPFTNSTHLGTGVCRENTNTGAIYVFRVAPNSTSMEINTMTGVASGTRTIRTGENYAFHGSYYVA